MTNVEWDCIWIAIFTELIGFSLLILWLQYQVGKCRLLIRLWADNMQRLTARVEALESSNKPERRHKMPEVTYYRDRKGEWRWSLVAANGRKIADSGEGYQNRKDCEDGFALVLSSVQLGVGVSKLSEPANG